MFTIQSIKSSIPTRWVFETHAMLQNAMFYGIHSFCNRECCRAFLNFKGIFLNPSTSTNVKAIMPNAVICILINILYAILLLISGYYIVLFYLLFFLTKILFTYSLIFF